MANAYKNGFKKFYVPTHKNDHFMQKHKLKGKGEHKFGVWLWVLRKFTITQGMKPVEKTVTVRVTVT